MTPHELLDRVRRRTLELLIADDGDLDYRTAERQAAREIAIIERLKPQTVAPQTTPVQENRGADPKARLLRKLETIARCLSQPLGQAAGSAGVDQARNYSLAERLALLPAPRRLKIIETLTNEQALDVFHDWEGFWARPKQLAQPGIGQPGCCVPDAVSARPGPGPAGYRSARCSTRDAGLPWRRVPLPTHETT